MKFITSPRLVLISNALSLNQLLCLIIPDKLSTGELERRVIGSLEAVLKGIFCLTKSPIRLILGTMKKDTKKEKTFTEGQVAVLLEEIRSQQKAIFEGQDIIKKDAKEIKATLDEHTHKIDLLEMRTLRMEKMVGVNTDDIAAIKEDIRLIKEDFSKRVAALEVKVTSLNR